MDFGEFEEFRRIFTSFKKYYKNSFKHTNMSNTYYEPSDLRKFGNITEWSEELGKKFFDYYGSVFEEGALSAREKSLIALAVSHVVKREGFPACLKITAMARQRIFCAMFQLVYYCTQRRGQATWYKGQNEC